MTTTDEDSQPLQIHAAGLTSPALPRCKQRVPAVLCNGLRGPDAPRCVRRLTIDGKPHTGQCRAARGIPQVGRTEWTWKPTTGYQPAEVTLPTPWLGVSASGEHDAMGLITRA